MMTKEIKEVAYERRYISKELCRVLDKIRENVGEYAWHALKITDVEASRILAKKVIEAKIV